MANANISKQRRSEIFISFKNKMVSLIRAMERFRKSVVKGVLQVAKAVHGRLYPTCRPGDPKGP